MLFNELEGLPYDKNTDRINIESIVEILPKCPIEIINDIYADHGRKDAFQTQYGNIDISELHWEIIAIKGIDLIDFTLNKDFSQWVTTCENRLDKFADDEWGCISTIKNIQESWKTNKTWLRPPYFFDSNVLDLTQNKLHLVEGHTRLGILMGLINKKIVSPTMTHKVWLGKINGNY